MNAFGSTRSGRNAAAGGGCRFFAGRVAIARAARASRSARSSGSRRFAASLRASGPGAISVMSRAAAPLVCGVVRSARGRQYVVAAGNLLDNDAIDRVVERLPLLVGEVVGVTQGRRARNRKCQERRGTHRGQCQALTHAGATRERGCRSGRRELWKIAALRCPCRTRTCWPCRHSRRCAWSRSSWLPGPARPCRGQASPARSCRRASRPHKH